jgi:hypothetical protein
MRATSNAYVSKVSHALRQLCRVHRLVVVSKISVLAQGYSLICLSVVWSRSSLLVSITTMLGRSETSTLLSRRFDVRFDTFACFDAARFNDADCLDAARSLR